MCNLSLADTKDNETTCTLIPEAWPSINHRPADITHRRSFIAACIILLLLLVLNICLQKLPSFTNFHNASSRHWLMITVTPLSAPLLSPKCLQWAPPPPPPPCVLLRGSSGACRVAWISYNNLSSVSSITRKFTVIIIGKLEEPGLSGLLPGWLEVVCVCVCVHARACVCREVCSCGSSISGDSILTAQQPKEWREKWVEIDSLGGIWCILGIIFSIRGKCFVDGSVFTRGGVCCSEKVQHREGNKWEAIKSEMDLKNVLSGASLRGSRWGSVFVLR